jgi:hypothetical protein
LKGKIKIYFYGPFLLLSAGIAFAAIPTKNDTVVDAHTIVNGLFKSVGNVKTLTYTMVYTERLDGGTSHLDSSYVKLQRTPHRIFMKMSDGAEVLWAEGVNNGNAWVHPNSFPYVTLELDPDGMIMRKNQHHGVEYAGFDYFAAVLKQAADKDGKNFDSHFLYLGEITFGGVKCYKLVVIDPDFKYSAYVVLKGETVYSIAKKLSLSEYMIVQHNSLSSFTDVSAGQTIMVPNNYGKEITLYMNETSMLPMLLRVDDDKGLFEQYIFRNLKLNPVITDAEFSKDYKDYHF